MENFRKKLKNQGAFTLVEMLIVVAIIAILIAVSIPVMNTALEKTRVATDAANERAAKAAATVGYLSETLPDKAGGGSSGLAYTGGDYFYDAAAGKLVGIKDGISPYGKCTKGDGHKDMVIKVQLDGNGDVTINWTKDGNDSVSPHGIEIKTQDP